MKFNNLFKSLPFLSTFLLISFLTITNQKVSTKLRILIWNTPSLTLGNYLAISSGAGFLVSYIITTNLAKINQSVENPSLHFKDDNTLEQPNEYEESNINHSYDNILIERDIKDPSPTINASFRIIGKKDGFTKNFVSKNNLQYDKSFEYENDNYEQPEINENPNQKMSDFNDWNDESFAHW